MWRRLGGALAAILAGCDTPAAVCGEVGLVCLPPEKAVRTGYGFAPTTMVAGDFDGDGVVDVAAVSPASQTLTIAWGPEREAATAWALGEEIVGLASGDVDGDGRVDLVTALPASDAVVVVLARGGRVFEVGARIVVGAGPRAVVVVDLDRDGRGEIMTANSGDSQVSVVRDGEVHGVTVGVGAHALAAGDVDGDGAIDVAVALADSGEVQVLRGDGGGGLVAGDRVRVGAGPLAIVMADFDGDGRDEIATADALDDTVTVIDGDVVRAWPVAARPTGLVVVRDEALAGLGVLSEGTGEVVRFDPRTGRAASTAIAATGLAAGDLDGDGREEIVTGMASTAAKIVVDEVEDEHLVAGTAGTTATVRRGVEDGLVLGEAWRVEAWLGKLAAIDVDGDGLDEVLVDSATLLGLLLVSGTDGAVIGQQIEVPGLHQDARTMVAADVDADGRVDVVMVGQIGGSAAVVSLLQQEDGSFAAAGEPVTTSGGVAEYPVLGDIDGDGGVDVVTVIHTGQRLWLVRGDGAGGWIPDPMTLDAGNVGAMVGGDIDGDAQLDIVVVDLYRPQVSTFPNLGAGDIFPIAATGCGMSR